VACVETEEKSSAHRGRLWASRCYAHRTHTVRCRICRRSLADPHRNLQRQFLDSAAVLFGGGNEILQGQINRKKDADGQHATRCMPMCFEG
jgi:hypothetical protein